MTKSGKGATPPKERGCWLTGWLILMVVHGLFSAYLIYDLQKQGTAALVWVLPTLFIVALAKVVAAFALWRWKRWGFWLYGIAIAVGIAAGLVITRSNWIVFHDIIPLVITGYIVRDKRQLFD